MCRVLNDARGNQKQITFFWPWKDESGLLWCSQSVYHRWYFARKKPKFQKFRKKSRKAEMQNFSNGAHLLGTLQKISAIFGLYQFHQVTYLNGIYIILFLVRIYIFSRSCTINWPALKSILILILSFELNMNHFFYDLRHSIFTVRKSQKRSNNWWKINK